MILTNCVVEEEANENSSFDDSINDEEKELEKIIKLNLKNNKYSFLFLFKKK